LTQLEENHKGTKSTKILCLLSTFVVKIVTAMKITIFDTHKFEKEYLISANKSGHDLKFLKVGLNLKTVEMARGAEVIIIFVNDDASGPVLEKLAQMNIKQIALRSAGYNHVDLERAKELGMRIANVPVYSPYAVAEHTVALMLSLNRKLVRANNRIKEMNFSLDGLVGFDMNGKTAGIIGVGTIGAVVARILYGFGCNLLGYDVYQKPELAEKYGLVYTDLDRLFRESDIITLHTPLMESTRYLINSRTLAMMKRGVMLINTSRGGLVKTDDLIDSLKSGQIGYLGLDVYEEERGLFFFDRSEDILLDDVIARLMTFQNVLITSHQGFLTTSALKNIAETTFYNIDCWQQGRESENELVAK
jgi:D-lactate dehydrogenase